MTASVVLRGYPVFPIGAPGTPWGEAERAAWRALQTKKRDYVADAVKPVHELVGGGGALAGIAESVFYGSLDYSNYHFGLYNLIGVKSKPWIADRKSVIITGGVHGYETSGVQGAVTFLQRHFAAYTTSVNLVVVPCVVPWAYETINRWNPEAIDPNRSFNPDAPGCAEAALAMNFIRATVGNGPILAHFDLHETTNTDNTEFVPAKFARDGVPPTPWHEIPDGFYVFGDTERPNNLDFLSAIIEGVRSVTHIAQADTQGMVAGEAIAKEGVIIAPDGPLRLCALHTNATYAVTTEVYPDSKRTNPAECNAAQAKAVCSGIDYALSQ